MTVDEVQAKVEAIKKKYIPFTDFDILKKYAEAQMAADPVAACENG